MPAWRLLSNHGLTLICLARNPQMTLREIGDWVGITERTAHQITKELCADGYLTRSTTSGRSRYTVHSDMPLRHSEMRDHTVGEMLATLVEPPSAGKRRKSAKNPPSARRKKERRDLAR
jgi:DNA-binding MarR family transcriptional regulator